MTQAKTGDTVKIHYTGRLADGSVFDSSEGRDPLEFTIGNGQVIPGFEEGVVGMAPGEKKTVTIPPEQAYGPHRPEMVQEVPRTMLAEGLQPEVGMQLQAQGPQGEVIPLRVVAVADETFTVDGNHPLAGKDLEFDIELVDDGPKIII